MFTEDQQESFRNYQQYSGMHPFTCSGHDALEINKNKIYCPQCPYTQDWAHSWMLNWEWLKSLHTFALILLPEKLKEKRQRLLTNQS